MSRNFFGSHQPCSQLARFLVLCWGGCKQLPGPPPRPGSLCWRPCRPPGLHVGIGLSLLPLRWTPSHFTLVGSWCLSGF